MAERWSHSPNVVGSNPSHTTRYSKVIKLINYELSKYICAWVYSSVGRATDF